MESNTTNTIIIDAKDAVLGRLASFAAKQALGGKSIVIINCREVLITGRKNSIAEEYKESRQRGGAILRGPFFPTVPERIVKRTVRGMLPYKQQRGRDAFKRVMCYNATPKEFEAAQKFHSESFSAHSKKTTMVKLGVIAKQL